MSKCRNALNSVFDRSDKASSALPRLAFTVLRAVDPYFQYILIFHGYDYPILS